MAERFIPFDQKASGLRPCDGPLPMEPIWPISELDLANLVAASGNHEGMALLHMVLGLSPRDQVFTPIEMNAELNQRQIEGRGWHLGSNNYTRNWCEWSLEPIGLVVKAATYSDSGSIEGFQVSPYGQATLALPAWLLEWSQKPGRPSLRKTYGSTASQGGSISTDVDNPDDSAHRSRAPYHRIRALRAIHEAHKTGRLPMRQDDLIKAIDIPQSISSGLLQSIKKAGLITYEAVDQDTHFRSFGIASSAPDTAPPKYSNLRYEYVGAVLEILSNNPGDPLTLDKIAAELHKRGLDRKDSNISGLLEMLLRTGYVESEAQFTYDSQSSITLTAEQATMLGEVVEILDRFQSGDSSFIVEGVEKARGILRDPERVTRYMEQAHIDYGYKSAHEWRTSILSLFNHGVVLTVRDVQELLSGGDRELEHVTLSAYLRELTKGNTPPLIRVRAGSAYIYQLNPDHPDWGEIK